MGANLWASGITAAVVIWAIWLGAEAGLGHALANLFAAVCAAVLGLAALNPLVQRVIDFILGNLYYTRFLVFWAVFFLVFGILWQAKQSLMKVKIAFPAVLDHVGGGVVGGLVGLVFASAVVLTVFVPPKASTTPKWASWSGDVLLRAERALPALYSAFSKPGGGLKGEYGVDEFIRLWRDPMYLETLKKREAGRGGGRDLR